MQRSPDSTTSIKHAAVADFLSTIDNGAQRSFVSKALDTLIGNKDLSKVSEEELNQILRFTAITVFGATGRSNGSFKKTKTVGDKSIEEKLEL
jgi:hypothetical protein